MTIERVPEFPKPVTIEQVENGYLLTFSFDTESRYPRREPHDYESRKPRVFPSKSALFAHLAEHFTHEAVSVPMDKAPPPVEQGYVTGQGFTEFGRRE